MPLTPALSLGERENLPPPFCQSGASRFVAARDAVSPLPAGEGQGEGNETPPTKTPGRILQAQPDRRPEPIACAAKNKFPDVLYAGPTQAGKRVGVSSVASPSPRPSPLGRGRIARRVFANPERLDSSQRGTRCPLSLRERARVRGNETKPTETAGRILLAQLDRLSDSELTITSSAKPVDGGRAPGRKRIGVSSVASPSPQPSPLGRGRIARRCVSNRARGFVRVSRT